MLHLPFALILGALFLVAGNGVVWFDEKSRKDAQQFKYDVFVLNKVEAVERYNQIRAKHSDYEIQVVPTDIKYSLIAINTAVVIFTLFATYLTPVYPP